MRLLQWGLLISLLLHLIGMQVCRWKPPAHQTR
jgi:hypothetical protein